MVVVNEGRGVVMEEPSGDQGVSRGQNANKSILGSTLGQLRLPSPCNSQAAQIGEIQLVGLKGRDDGVDLFSDVFQLGQTSLVLDVGTNPLVDLSLAGPSLVHCLPIDERQQCRHGEDQRKRRGTKWTSLDPEVMP